MQKGRCALCVDGGFFSTRGSATRGVAHSSAQQAGVRRPACLNSTTVCHLLMDERPPQPISRFGAELGPDRAEFVKPSGVHGRRASGLTIQGARAGGGDGMGSSTRRRTRVSDDGSRSSSCPTTSQPTTPRLVVSARRRAPRPRSTTPTSAPSTTSTTETRSRSPSWSCSRAAKYSLRAP